MITGANGHLGRRLIAQLSGKMSIIAVVRSAAAAQKLQESVQQTELTVHVLDYTDTQTLKKAAEGCAYIVHLVGIIKESSTSLYEQAHEATCQTLVAAADRQVLKRIIYLSILGSHPQSFNACLASKGRAEQILLDSGLQVLSLRVPMVLGEGDFAAYALKSRASKPFSVVFRAGSMEQPIYAGDVVDAICAGLDPDVNVLPQVDLAGPTALTRGELTRKAAQVLSQQTRVISIPLWIGMLLAGVLEFISPNPPVTRAMLGVLDHDDCVDTRANSDALGIQVTSLDEMLDKVLA
jgi:NADH dehydrogenase